METGYGCFTSCFSSLPPHMNEGTPIESARPRKIKVDPPSETERRKIHSLSSRKEKVRKQHLSQRSKQQSIECLIHNKIDQRHHHDKRPYHTVQNNFMQNCTNTSNRQKIIIQMTEKRMKNVPVGTAETKRLQQMLKISNQPQNQQTRYSNEATIKLGLHKKSQMLLQERRAQTQRTVVLNSLGNKIVIQDKGFGSVQNRNFDHQKNVFVAKEEVKFKSPATPKLWNSIEDVKKIMSTGRTNSNFAHQERQKSSESKIIIQLNNKIPMQQSWVSKCSKNQCSPKQQKKVWGNSSMAGSKMSNSMIKLPPELPNQCMSPSLKQDHVNSIRMSQKQQFSIIGKLEQLSPILKISSMKKQTMSYHEETIKLHSMYQSAVQFQSHASTDITKPKNGWKLSDVIVESEQSTERVRKLKFMGAGRFFSNYIGFLQESKFHFTIKEVSVFTMGNQAIQHKVGDALDYATRMSHPNVLQIYRSCTICNKLSIFQQYGDRNLDEELSRHDGRFSEEKAVKTLRQILNGLSYLHTYAGHGFVHKSLKPKNIIFVNDTAKIEWLGYQDSMISGYISPEMRRGSPHGKKADIWSLGIIAYVMIFGAMPIIDNEVEVGYKQILSIEKNSRGSQQLKHCPETDEFDCRSVSISSFSREGQQMVKLSPEYESFLKKCLQDYERQRMSAIECLAHPLLIKYE